MRRGRRSGLYTMVAVHSTARGPSLGGCRMWSYEDSRAAVVDALRLSRAMTSKSAVAGLPLGGGKGVIMLPAGTPALEPATRRDALLDFGETVAQLDGRYVTAEDVGTSDADMTVIAEQTEHVAGLALERGGSGDPSPWTALGVETAIRVTCERVWGTSDLAGRSIAVIGLGHVGGTLARGLAAAGASLVLADVAPGKRALAEELGAAWAEPGEALRAEVDLVAPCALGGVLDHATVPLLRCRAVAGAANNQLAIGRDRRGAARARDPLGAGLRRERGRHHQHRRRAGAGGLLGRARPRPRAGDRRHDRHRARHGRELRARRRSRRRRSSRGGGWRRPGRRSERPVGTPARNHPLPTLGIYIDVNVRTPGAEQTRPTLPRRHRPTGPRPPGSDPLRQPPLLAQLLQVRLQRPARGQPEPLRHLVPRRREQLVLRARARRERLDDAALALQPVPDVLVELRRRRLRRSGRGRGTGARGRAPAAGAGRRGTHAASRRRGR